MHKRIIIFFLLLINLFASIDGQRIKSFVSVTKLPTEQEAPINSVVYYLTKTIVKIEVAVEKRIYKAGVFSAYSENLLNMSPIVSKDSVSWNIVEIKISTSGEADKEKRYSIIATGDASGQFISLGSDGRLKGFNLSDNIEEEVKLDYRVENEFSLDDVSFSAVPFLEKQLKTTSMPAMASSSAEMIYKLRKRQLKLAGFEYEHHPSDKELMNYSLSELKRQEQMFEELFVGKKMSQRIVKTFLVESDNLSDSLESLFNFSIQNGFVDAEDVTSNRYFFRCSGFNNATTTETSEGKNKNAKRGLVYNLAETINFHLLKDSNEVFIKKVQIASKNLSADISPKILMKKDVRIELDEATGGLKSISNNSEK